MQFSPQAAAIDRAIMAGVPKTDEQAYWSMLALPKPTADALDRAEKKFMPTGAGTTDAMRRAHSEAYDATRKQLGLNERPVARPSSRRSIKPSRSQSSRS